MEFVVAAVKDELTERFMEPQFFRSDKEAIRIFTAQVNDIKLWKDNSADYSLFLIGKFDEEKGFTDGTITKVIGGRAVLKGDQNA